MWPFKKKSQFPDADWLSRVSNLHPHTKDMHQLEQKFSHRLFVVDNMKQNRGQQLGNHSLIADQNFICEAFTQSHQFTMRMKDGGKTSLNTAIPIMHAKETDPEYVPSHGALPRLPLKGELWAINPQRFYILDEQRQNGIQFQRCRVTIIIPYKEIFFKDRQHAENLFRQIHKTETGGLKLGETPLKSVFEYRGVLRCDAWMYLGIPDYWNNLFDGGYVYPPAKVHDANNDLFKQCYNFTGG